MISHVWKESSACVIQTIRETVVRSQAERVLPLGGASRRRPSEPYACTGAAAGSSRRRRPPRRSELNQLDTDPRRSSSPPPATFFINITSPATRAHHNLYCHSAARTQLVSLQQTNKREPKRKTKREWKWRTARPMDLVLAVTYTGILAKMELKAKQGERMHSVHTKR